LPKGDPASDRKRERYEEIIKAAGEVFSMKGFHRARVEEIARLAGIGKGTVYEYFKSKKHLFIEVIKYFSSNFLEDFKVAARQGKDYREKLENALGLLVNVLHDSSVFFELLMRDHWEMDEKLYQWMTSVRREATKVIEDILREGMESGKLRDISPRIPAMILIESCLMVLFPGALEGDGEKPDEIKNTVIDVVINGISKK